MKEVDSLDRYHLLLDKLSSEACTEGYSAIDLLESPSYRDNCPEVLEALSLREALLTSHDLEFTRGYLELGFLSSYQGNARVAAWMVTFELEDEIAKKNLSQSCLPYTSDQPLFRSIPELFHKIRKSKKGSGDLLDASRFDWDPTGQIVDFGHTKARLYGKAEVVSWIRKEFPSSPLYVRLHPFQVGPDLLALLLEEAIRPIDPVWWKELRIWPNDQKVGIYELLPCSIGENLRQYWDREIKGFGRLEVSFSRNSRGLLSGMIEEIPRLSKRGFFTGRCLHMTSHDEVGTNWDASLAAHVDGAVNVYIGENMAGRWDNTLEKGKACDATCRTHVFRVENIPLKAVVPLAELFFESECLVKDWINDQFGTCDRKDISCQ